MFPLHYNEAVESLSWIIFLEKVSAVPLQVAWDNAKDTARSKFLVEKKLKKLAKN